MQRACQENCHLQKSISYPTARKNPHLWVVFRWFIRHALPGKGEDCQKVWMQPPGGVLWSHHPLPGKQQQIRLNPPYASSKEKVPTQGFLVTRNWLLLLFCWHLYGQTLLESHGPQTGDNFFFVLQSTSLYWDYVYFNDLKPKLISHKMKIDFFLVNIYT